MTLPDPASPLGRLSHHLSAVTGPRWQRRPSHLFHEILLMGLCTFFTGGRTFVDMAHFALSHQSWLSTFLTLPGGPPCHDTFNRVFSALDPRQLEDALRHWSAGLEIAPLPADHGPPQLRHLAIDGKVLRGSRRGPGTAHGERARAVVNLWLAGQGLVLAQRRIPEECSEIVQAPLLLRHLCLKNTIVTTDAAHAQTATASQITAQGGDYLLTVKANQPTTQQAIRDYLAPAPAATPAGHYQTIGKAHNCIDTRRCWLRTDLADFAPAANGAALAPSPSLKPAAKTSPPAGSPSNNAAISPALASRLAPPRPTPKTSPPRSPNWRAPTGASRTACTGGSTSSLARTPAAPAPEKLPPTSPFCAKSPSTPSKSTPLFLAKKELPCPSAPGNTSHPSTPTTSPPSSKIRP